MDSKATLGEGPVWDHKQSWLYWVDILGKKIHRYDPITQINSSVDVEHYVGAIAIRESGCLIAALDDGFYLVDFESGQKTFINDPEEERKHNRFNDGKCDPAGRFWAGTMEIDAKKPNGALYCVDVDFQVRKVLDDVTISNGLAWSPDYRSMYYIDTPTQQIVAFDYDLERGEISNKKVVITVPIEDGSPDGMTIDEEGMLWVAYWNGSKVVRWNPQTQQPIDIIHIPAINVTSCVFGGSNLDELYVTTARTGLSEEQLKSHPLSGGVFRVKTEVRGTISARFKGSR